MEEIQTSDDLNQETDPNSWVYNRIREHESKKLYLREKFESIYQYFITFTSHLNRVSLLFVKFQYTVIEYFKER